jgi:hypothetical protein
MTEEKIWWSNLNAVRTAPPNALTYVVSFEFYQKPDRLKRELLQDFYVTQGLSLAQIANRLGWAKSTVYKRLSSLGLIEGKNGRAMKSNNFRHHQPPYGFRVQSGKLIPNKAELRICRLIVHFVDEEGMTLRQTATDLESREFKNRFGKVSWHHQTVGKIYKRWKGKL